MLRLGGLDAVPQRAACRLDGLEPIAFVHHPGADVIARSSSATEDRRPVYSSAWESSSCLSTEEPR